MNPILVTHALKICEYYIAIKGLSTLFPTAGGMASKGERSDHLSSYNKFDANEDLRIPLKPLLAIPLVGVSLFFILLSS